MYSIVVLQEFKRLFSLRSGNDGQAHTSHTLMGKDHQSKTTVNNYVRTYMHVDAGEARNITRRRLLQTTSLKTDRKYMYM